VGARTQPPRHRRPTGIDLSFLRRLTRRPCPDQHGTSVAHDHDARNR
jgi:hypothetical protein